MAAPQKKIREIVLQLLFSYDFMDIDEADSISFFMAELSVTRSSVVTAIQRVKNIKKNLIQIDALITEASVSYDFCRIQRVEKNALRIGLYELFFDDEVPYKVAIAEALRITRKFSNAEATTFVNAILDCIYKKSLSTEKIDLKIE